MKTTFIEKFKLGLSIKGFYLCKEKHLRYTKNNDLYLDVTLFDSSGTIRAKMWNNIEQYKERFALGDPVAVKGIIDEYDNQLQLIISHINKGFLPNLSLIKKFFLFFSSMIIMENMPLI